MCVLGVCERICVYLSACGHSSVCVCVCLSIIYVPDSVYVYVCMFTCADACVHVYSMRNLGFQGFLVYITHVIIVTSQPCLIALPIPPQGGMSLTIYNNLIST